MGSMWLDPNEDPRVYPTIPTNGMPVPDFDPQNMTGAKQFPPKAWGADFVSLLALIEFTGYQHPATKQVWQDLVIYNIGPPPAKDGVDMENAIKELISLQRNERTTLMPEILAQSGDFQMYFCAQLGIYPSSHPNSYQLLKISARIGELVMVYLKRKWASESVRPSHKYPRLTPPLPVPPHASYPSGHAMISHILALTAKDLVPMLGSTAEELARRIARNRQVAGLHFQWDTNAGEQAAANVHRILQDLRSYKKYLKNAADEDEWS